MDMKNIAFVAAALFLFSNMASTAVTAETDGPSPADPRFTGVITIGRHNKIVGPGTVLTHRLENREIAERLEPMREGCSSQRAAIVRARLAARLVIS